MYDYYDSILDGLDEPRRASVGSVGSRESWSGDNEYEDSIFEKTGYQSSMGVDGDDESSVFGRKKGAQQQQQGWGLFPRVNALSRLSMMSNQSLSIGGVSDGNVREDDTMISVCFFSFMLFFGVDKVSLCFRCSEVDMFTIVLLGQSLKLRPAYMCEAS